MGQLQIRVSWDIARRERKLRLGVTIRVLRVLANRIDSGHLKGDPETTWALNVDFRSVPICGTFGRFAGGAL
jgi:hypothetical protein